MRESLNSLRTIFNEALEREDARERAEYLVKACGSDSLLRRKIEELLAAHGAAGGFLKNGVGSANGLEATVALPVTEKAGDRIGRYKLLEQIGEGGCGVVYVAEQEEPVRRRVALKIVKLGMDTKSVIARFEAERQVLALMDHPNIAKVLDAGATETGRPYFVMELVRGIKITDYCDQHHLSPPERLELFVQVCHAVQHAHQKGIIHRDIKPSNILVTVNDGVPLPIVIDFGIAKATSQQRLTDKTVYTAFEQFIGTPAYMSPEQAEMTNLDINTRSDVYALGVLLYELLTGKTPFDAQTLLAAGLDEMRRIIREQEPVRPSTRLGTMVEGELTTTAQQRQSEPPKLIHLVRGDLDWIVMKCLDKDRRRRYETANGLAQDIERHLKHEPVVARPPSTAYRVQKFVRRNKLAVGAASAVAAALVLGIAISAWEAVRATRAEHQQEQLRTRAEAGERNALAAQAKEASQRTKAERAQAEEAAQRLQAQRHLYAANLNLAQLAWDQDNLGHLRELLEETARYPQRGFEWYFWQQRAHLELQTLRGHARNVVRVAFSPDGGRVATGSFDRTAKVWDANTGKELLTLRGHSAPVWWVAFSPDGQKLVTGSFDQTAKVWDAASGEGLLTLKGHSGPVASVAFSPDGHRVATASADQTVRLWDAATGEHVLTLTGHTGWVWSVAFSPDGRRIVTGGHDRTAKVWDAATGQEVRTLRGHTSQLCSAAFSQDGRRILTSGDRTAKVWDSGTGEVLLTLEGHRAAVSFAAFSPDCRRIVTSSYDQTAKEWDATSGKELFTLKGHGAQSTSVAFSPDGQRIATSDVDQTAKVWALAGERGVVTLTGHTNGILSVAFSPDGRRILTGSEDCTAKVWDSASGQELRALKAHATGVTSVAFSPDGQRLATVGAGDPIARVFDALTGKSLLIFTGHRAGMRAVAYSPDGRRIATGSGNRMARVWDAVTGRELLKLEGHSGQINSVAFSPDGERIVTGSEDGTAGVWDGATGRPLLALRGHGGGFGSAAVNSVAFSPDGRKIVTGSRDQTARVWDATNGTNLVTLRGHGDQVLAVAFSPDGQRIGTGSVDQTAKVWEANSGKELLTLKGHSDAVASVAWSPDGLSVATGSWDGTARVWDAASAAQVTGWREEERATAERLAAQERERAAAAARDRAVCAQDPGAIKRWLVLLPIPYEGRDGNQALRAEQVAPESQLRPRAGQRIKVGAAEFTWRAVEQADYRLDFNGLAGAVAEWHVGYTVAYVRSETDQRDVALKVGSDDQCRVYLNGRLVHQSLAVRGYEEDKDVVGGLDLKAGVNVLVFKVVNEVAGWEGSVRLTDPDGNPLKGIRVVLDPEGSGR